MKDNNSYESRTAQSLDIDIKKNAFNQKEEPGYYYQATDIMLIQNILMRPYLDNFVIHNPIGDIETINKTLKNLIESVDVNKPTLCVYNLGNSHWISFAALKKNDETYILYKDSKGSNNEKFEEQIQKINKATKFIANTANEQTTGVECGIFALQNMEIMAKSISHNKEEFIKEFESFKSFCSLSIAQNLRAEDFANKYVLGKYQEMLNEAIHSSELRKIREQHFEEAVLIESKLKEESSFTTLTIKALKAEESLGNTQNTIAIEIATSPDTNTRSSDYLYNYRISLSKNLPKKTTEAILNKIREILQISPNDAPSDTDNRVLSFSADTDKLISILKAPKKLISYKQFIIEFGKLCANLNIEYDEDLYKLLQEKLCIISQESHEYLQKHIPKPQIKNIAAESTVLATSSDSLQTTVVDTNDSMAESTVSATSSDSLQTTVVDTNDSMAESSVSATFSDLLQTTVVDTNDSIAEDEKESDSALDHNVNKVPFKVIPDKAEGNIRVVSYNIATDFSDKDDTTADKRHTWAYRAPLVKTLLTQTKPDVMCLQELSADQAVELVEYFKKEYKSIFLSQAPTLDMGKAGLIAEGEEVKDWRGKYAGTPFLGIFIRNNWNFIEKDRFWLNEDPDITPKGTPNSSKPQPVPLNGCVPMVLTPSTKSVYSPGKEDDSKISSDAKFAPKDKGFGNVKTYRAVLWIEIQNKEKEKVFVFNSHYPLSGTSETRYKCAKLEREKITEITEDVFWISAGDRNIILDKEGYVGFYTYKKVFLKLVENAHDSRDSDNHYGTTSTFTGFTYDPVQLEIDPQDSKKNPVLDVIVSNKVSELSFCHPGGFKVDENLNKTLVDLDNYTTDNINKMQEGRRVASDHSMIGGDYKTSSMEPELLDHSLTTPAQDQQQCLPVNLVVQGEKSEVKKRKAESQEISSGESNTNDTFHSFTNVFQAPDLLDHSLTTPAQNQRQCKKLRKTKTPELLPVKFDPDNIIQSFKNNNCLPNELFRELNDFSCQSLSVNSSVSLKIEDLQHASTLNSDIDLLGAQNSDSSHMMQE